MAKVFLSFRHEDKKIAETLQKAIHTLSEGGIRILYYLDIPGSAKWRKAIERDLRSADALIFLHTAETAGLRWCLYEIGVFRGSHGRDGEASDKVICIRAREIEEAPDPIADRQGYTANRKDLEKFFKELVFSNKILPPEVYTPDPELFVRQRDNLPGAISAFSTVFAPPYAYKPLVPILSFHLAQRVLDTDHGDKLDYSVIRHPVEEIPVTGQEALRLFEINDDASDLDMLERLLRPDHQADWLLMLKDIVGEIRQKKREQLVLQALRSFTAPLDGRTYLPVVSAYERFRGSLSEEDDDLDNQWKKIEVSLVPTSFPGSDQIDLREIFDLKRATFYSPASIVQIRLKDGIDRATSLEDIDGEPVVCRHNPDFERLFDFVGGRRHGFTQTDELLNATWVLGRLSSGMVTPELLEKIKLEQVKLMQRVVVEGRRARAKTPLELSNDHTEYPGKVFLPDILCTQVIPNVGGGAKILLLVAYVEDFWPDSFLDGSSDQQAAGDLAPAGAM